MPSVNIEILRRIRKEKGLSGPKLAKLAGLSKDTISRIESGKGAGKGPWEGTLKSIADALQVDVYTLIKDSGGEAELQKRRESADKLYEIVQGEMAQKIPVAPVDEEIEGLKVSALLTRVVEILESSSIYRQALAANINAFHLAIRSEEKVHSLQGRIDYLEGQNKSLESRLSALEEKIK